MASKYIYFKEDIEAKLKNEDNMSSLIDKLLREHYQKVDNPFEGLSEEQLKKELKIVELKEKFNKDWAAIQNGSTI